MEDIKQLMQRHYITYASYVILDRAIPHVIDGLKPVQRRILYMLWLMHDGKMHKVANVAGQTMALHPHGDAAIIDALVNIANKGYLIDTQGNFGNLLTGDPAAASRYIEVRLSPLGKEVLFNPDLTQMLDSYDGRYKEPIVLPAKIPLVLLQGIDGIAVGMSTHIFPHNFTELLEAEIALLDERPFTILPDFPTGGIMDASSYEKGMGKVKLRARIEVQDAKTLVIREVCYGTTTESLMQSIEDAAKKGKIKIDAINDYTADKVEIEIKLPRGSYAQDLLDGLYAYTLCEVTLHSQIMVIKDQLPWEADTDSILRLHIQKLQEYLRLELEIEKKNFLEKIFERSLEQIFIEHRMYQLIETLSSYEIIHQTIADQLKPFHDALIRIPTYEDRERLLNIPIRRISRFDILKNQEEVAGYHVQLTRIEKELTSIKKVTIRYLEGLIKKYGKHFPRKTEIQSLQQVDLRAMETKNIQIGFDPALGFIGTKVPGPVFIECTNFDKLLLLYNDGSYQVITIPEKMYVHKGKVQIVYTGVADKKTVLSAVYRDSKTHLIYGKRFIITKFILDKTYRFMEESLHLEFISSASKNSVELQFYPKAKQTISKKVVELEAIILKGVASKGNRLANRPVKKVIAVT